jgi:hypothetical protein
MQILEEYNTHPEVMNSIIQAINQGQSSDGPAAIRHENNYARLSNIILTEPMQPHPVMLPPIICSKTMRLSAVAGLSSSTDLSGMHAPKNQVNPSIRSGLLNLSNLSADRGRARTAYENNLDDRNSKRSC